ncbi:hypothetical protein [Streptacidiphilus sp. P02-A3a]|uniref:hypothetical protein n=1 Tax=Streptacidiphilus sp. P02-A3a TaxID=2704468 RepID=UPI0015FC957B|nr:hypothetical protein [Streptacidiphilus sp. P02-A3a]
MAVPRPEPCGARLKTTPFTPAFAAAAWPSIVTLADAGPAYRPPFGATARTDTGPEFAVPAAARPLAAASPAPAPAPVPAAAAAPAPVRFATAEYAVGSFLAVGRYSVAA